MFNTAKRVRTETHVAEAPVSISSAAVEMAEQAFGGLQDKTVMIIGAGQMGELAARHLVSKGRRHGAGEQSHSHRMRSRWRRSCADWRFNSARFGRPCADADIVISSTGCPHYIITRDDMAAPDAGAQRPPDFSDRYRRAARCGPGRA